MNLCVNCFNKKSDGICPYCGYAGESPLDKSILKPGTIINDKYIIGRALGRGGFGISYLAFDKNLKIIVCIKEYFPAELSSRNAETTNVIPFTGQVESNFEYGKSKFIEEGRTLARFNAIPTIVTVHDFFEANGTAYIVMEYLDGVDLGVYLENQPDKKLDWEKTLVLLNSILPALSEVHMQGVVHRDISPDNIFITKYNQVKLLDFGAARYAIGEQAKSMSVILKHGYAPFEQYSRNGKQGPWTDIYAICATVYHCLTGVKPPDSPDRIEEDLINLPSGLGSDIPDYAEKALMRGLSVSYQKRYQSVEDLIMALKGDAVPENQKGTIAEPKKFTSKLNETINRIEKKNIPVISKLGVKKASIVLASVLMLLVAVIFVFNGNGSDQQAMATDSIEKSEQNMTSDNSRLDTSQNHVSTPKPEPTATPTPTLIKEKARWRVSSSSYLISKDQTHYSPALLTDNDYLTCWIPGNNRNGIGESITFEVANGEEAYFSAIKIFAGYGKSKRYLTNLRAKNISVYLDGKYFDDFDLLDVEKIQSIDFNEEVSAVNVKIVFNSYYDCVEVSGTNSYNDLCISEMDIEGYVLKK